MKFSKIVKPGGNLFHVILELAFGKFSVYKRYTGLLFWAIFNLPLQFLNAQHAELRFWNDTKLQDFPGSSNIFSSEPYLEKCSKIISSDNPLTKPALAITIF